MDTSKETEVLAGLNNLNLVNALTSSASNASCETPANVNNHQLDEEIVPTIENKLPAQRTSHGVDIGRADSDDMIPNSASNATEISAAEVSNLDSDLTAALTKVNWVGTKVNLTTLDVDESSLPVGKSTFSVYLGTVAEMAIIAKVIPIDTYDRLNYAKDEVERNFQARGYDSWKCVRSSAYAVDAVNRKVYIIAQRNMGTVPTSDYLADARQLKQEQWILHLAEALACCHVTNVFHQDVRNGPSTYAPNVMIDIKEPNTLRLIDLGDSVTPKSDSETAAALIVDLEGMLSFVSLFGNVKFTKVVGDLLQDMRDLCGSVKNKNLTPTSNQCRLYLYRKLSPLIDFPPGFGTLVSNTLDCTEAML